MCLFVLFTSGLLCRFAPRNDGRGGLLRRYAPRNDGRGGLLRRYAPRNDGRGGLLCRFAPRNDDIPLEYRENKNIARYLSLMKIAGY